MTREEATEILENKENYVGIQHIPGADVYISRGLVEAINVALSALRPVSRERVEKVWRGEWKPIERLWKYSHQWQCSRCGHPTLIDKKQFCDNCGAPMTDEAVQMVMERLEKLHEDNGCP